MKTADRNEVKAAICCAFYIDRSEYRAEPDTSPKTLCADNRIIEQKPDAKPTHTALAD